MTEPETQSERGVFSSYLPRVASGALINFSGIFSRMAIIYLYTVLLARMLPVGQVGEYFLMVTIVGLVGLAALVGLDIGVVRYVALFGGEGRLAEARKTLSAGLLVGVPVGVVFAAALAWQAPVVSRHFLGGSAGSVTALRIFSLSVPMLVAARLFNATTQGMHRMRYQVYSRDMGEQVFKLGFSGVALAMGAGLFGIVWANVAALVLATVMSVYFAALVLKRPAAASKSDLDGKTPRSQGESPAGTMLRYSYPLALSNILVALGLQVDTLMLGLLGTTAVVGYYGVALKVSVLSARIITAFSLVFTPVIADLWNRGRTGELSQLYITVTRWIFALSLPFFIITVMFSSQVMKIFGAGFVAGGGALVILALGQLVNASTGAAGIMVLMSGRSKLELLNVLTALVVDALLCYLLIPRYGINGAAIANMASLGLVNAMRVVEIKFIMRMLAYDRSFIKPLLAGFSAAAAVFAISRLVISPAGVKQLAFLAAVLVFFYVLIMVALGLDDHDKNVLRKFKVRTARIKTT